MRWALELLVKPGLIHLCVRVCLHTTCMDWKCDLSLSIVIENALYPLSAQILYHHTVNVSMESRREKEREIHC